MIKERQGDLVKELKSGIMVHGCNAQGVMGSGFAGFLRSKYPNVFSVYQSEYQKKKHLDLGTITYYSPDKQLYIVNGITQEFYGRDGKRYVDYHAVRKVFQNVRKLAHEVKVYDIHFPLIGCGLAGGDWEVISKIIEEELPDGVFIKTLWKLSDQEPKVDKLGSVAEIIRKVQERSS